MELSTIFRSDIRFAKLMGVTHASRNPELYAGELAFDSFEYLLGIESFISGLEEQLKSPTLMQLTRARLTKIRADYAEHLEHSRKLLEPLGYGGISATEYGRYMDRRTSRHKIADYYNHLGKDWAWGAAEAEAGLKLIREVATDLNSPKEILTLGSGACRLPYEVHRWLKPSRSVCVDINPLLLSVAQQIVAGKTVNLIHFPTYPKDSDSYSLRLELAAPESYSSDFDFVVHDIGEWGFGEQKFDLVLTPWFIDVAPVPPARLFSQINSVLKPGGHWINFGPIGFNKLHLADSFSLEEVVELVKMSGFDLTQKRYEKVPHLEDPHSNHSRVERTLTFCARKTENREVVDAHYGPAVPPWLKDFSLPVQFPGALEILQRSLSFSLDLAMHAPQGMSIRQLAAAMSSRHKIPQENAEFLVQSTLKSWLAANRYNPNRNRA